MTALRILPLTLLLAASLAPAADVRAESSFRNPLEQAELTQKLGAQVPLDARFVDSTGKAVRLRDVIGERPVILNLVYFRCPMLCDMATDGFVQSLRAMRFQVGREFDIVTLSFDHREGPELARAKKKNVIEAYRTNAFAPEDALDPTPNWHFLTGDEDDIRRVTEAVGFRFEWDPLTNQYAHAAGLIVLTPEGVVSRYLSGVEFPARDLQLAIVEASEGRVSSIKDNVLLLCYQYDPAKGKYGFIIMPVIKLAAVATVATLAGAIVIFLRRERAGEFADQRPGVRGRESGVSQPTNDH